ncbi:hypothetical protein CC86DRAFT_449355 [Ophiobolus disseminans]|uniref:F-box domain-containing protein n=1 Tax=Ophiobolus disseminans TaxID=1469910 RepID=A0A6A6ZHK4_9PLEO|nr:hypothetical protein CC86DRAFT_449355 [Ophiobolus disseminans]
MYLVGLPAEIISRICSFLGSDSTSIPGETRTIHSQHLDLQSLRITCRDLYYKTTFDAAMLYSKRLKELEVALEYKSVAQLCQITKTPAFRDRIHILNLYDPNAEESSESEEISTNAESRENTQLEATEGFCRSNDALRLLTECFQNLDQARNLERIEVCTNRGHSVVLEAMKVVNLSRKLACLTIDPTALAKSGFGSLLSTPRAYASFISGLQIQPVLGDETCSENKMSKQKREKDPSGLHIQNYRSTTPEFTNLISALSDIADLGFYGCRSYPGIRLCHGCDDLFVKNVAPVFFPNISSLTVASTFISGGRLRSFVKRHAETLREVDMNYVILTDSSWRSIAQGLAKIPHLKRLKFASLRQKRPATVLTTNNVRPSGYTATNEVELVDRRDVQHFLRLFIVSFNTVLYSNPSRFCWSRPKCFEARLFQLP